MLTFRGPGNLHRVVVLNPKGGSGKSTLAFNIAGYLAGTGRRVALVDMDVQGSSSQWVRSRPPQLPHIHSIPAPYKSSREVSTEQIVEIPPEYDFAIVDAPASVAAEDLSDFTVGAHAILIPVLPSAFDIHAASRLVKDLLLVARVSRTNGRLGIVANRIRVRTLSYRRLQTFLSSLSISVVGEIRDSQNYVQAAHKGLCIHEMAPSAVRSDLRQWQQIADWIEQRLAVPLSERDWFRPEPREPMPENLPAAPERTKAALPAAAALLTAVVSSFFLWQLMVSDTESTTVQPAMAQPGPGPRAIERVAPAETDVRARFRDKWRLSGVAQSDGVSIVMLSQRGDDTTHRVRTGTQLDGWTVEDAGPDYAVFARNDGEVRLVLHEERAD